MTAVTAMTAVLQHFSFFSMLPDKFIVSATAHSRGHDCALSGSRVRTLGVATAHSRGHDCALVNLKDLARRPERLSSQV